MVDQVNNRMINIINLTKCLQEELELLGEGDDEGWVRARNYKGEVTGVLKLSNNLGIWFSAPCNYANNIFKGWLCAPVLFGD